MFTQKELVGLVTVSIANADVHTWDLRLEQTSNLKEKKIRMKNLSFVKHKQKI